MRERSRIALRSIRATGRRKHFDPTGKSQNPVKPRSEKYSAFQNTQIRLYLSRPRPPKGAFAVVTDAGRGMRWTRVVLLTRALSRGRRNRVVLTPSRRCQVGEDTSLATVATERGSPGRARISRKPSRAGMSGNSGGPVVTNSCVYLHFTREAAGASGARHSPRPLGRNDRQNSGEFAPRECGLISISVIAKCRRVGKAKRAHHFKNCANIMVRHGASAPFAHPTILSNVIASRSEAIHLLSSRKEAGLLRRKGSSQ